jgi:DNA modification methylase
MYQGKATKRDRTCDGAVTNTHCTVKPRALIKHLINLIMPPSPAAVLLDPFGGSGTAAVSCEELGRDYVVIERESEYVAIARERVEATRAEQGTAVQLPLFDLG